MKNNFDIAPDTEFSFEGEVRTLMDNDRLKILRKHGCTRVSFGVQTFDEKSRKLSGLKPTIDDINKCIKSIKGFDYEVNMDLMYGLPGQTLATWRRDLEKAIAYDSSNIDIYDTVLYPHTQLFKLRHKLKDELPDESERLKMLELAFDVLLDHGYTHETIEDFSKPLKAYKMKKLVYGGGNGRSEIIALGAAAVGVLNGFSYRNSPPADYMNWPDDDKELPIQLLTEFSQGDYKRRAMVFLSKVLGLQKKDVDLQWLERYRPVLENMKLRELITETATSITPTKKGLLWTDNIAMEFLDHKEQYRIWKIGY